MISYNFLKSDVVNNNAMATDELKKFQQSIAQQCDVKIDNNFVLK